MRYDIIKKILEVKIMPKYKDSPEVRAAKKERREKLRELSLA